MSVSQLNDTQFGLLGKSLSHSWSRLIHEQLGSAPYKLYEEPTEASAEHLIKEGMWQGINVTIPYKKLAASCATIASERVQHTGAANTLVKRDSSIYADNTDVLGFNYLLDDFFLREHDVHAKEALAGKKVLVLGSGGASRACVYAFTQIKATPVVISRTGQETYQSIVERHADAVLLVNTTPVGMYPNCPKTALERSVLASLPQLYGIIDLIYNPLRTQLLIDAEQVGLPCQNGLIMLVAQALYASELFQDKKLNKELIPQIESKLMHNTENIILIGMPGCGKTGAGKRLARIISRPFVDLDDVVTQIEGRTPAEILKSDGEEAFRAIETRICAGYASQAGLVIATGGGIVTKDRNYPLLHQNGTIIYLDRPLDELSQEGRPLSKQQGIDALAEQRLWRYKQWADITFSCTGSAQGDAEALSELLN